MNDDYFKISSEQVFFHNQYIFFLMQHFWKGEGGGTSRDGRRTINFAGQFTFQIQCNISNNSAQIKTISIECLCEHQIGQVNLSWVE